MGAMTANVPRKGNSHHALKGRASGKGTSIASSGKLKMFALLIAKLGSTGVTIANATAKENLALVPGRLAQKNPRPNVSPKRP